MLLVFFTLGLIIVAVVLLTKLPWLRAKQESEVPESARTVLAEAVEPAPATIAQAAASADDELAQVAAIAVALLEQHGSAAPRSVRPQVRSTGQWKRSGRMHQMGLSTFD
jgi:hypothetical protein